MISATMFEAKTNFSELVKQARNGETVIITSGRKRTPVARIEAIEPKKLKRLGVMETSGFVLGDAFWEPLPPGWDGEDD